MTRITRRPQPDPTATGNTKARRRSFNTFAAFVLVAIVLVALWYYFGIDILGGIR